MTGLEHHLIGDAWSGHLIRTAGRITGTLFDAHGWRFDLFAFRRTARLESGCPGLWLRGDVAAGGPISNALRAALDETPVITGQLDRAESGMWLGDLAQGPHVLAVTGRPSGPHRIELQAVPLPPKHRIWFENQVAHLHALGPRLFAELLRNLAAKLGGAAVIAELLEGASRLTPEMVGLHGGDQFHRPPPRQVPPELLGQET